MKGSDFVQTYANASQSGWEEGAVIAAQVGDMVEWPLIEVPLTLPPVLVSQGHSGSVFVTSDVFAVGGPEDFLRLPLSPIPAQRIANLRGGFLLPTRKIAQDIFKASTVKLSPIPQVNKGPNLAQYADYDQKVQAQLDNAGSHSGDLISGHKKDVVISANLSLATPKLAIYGWFKPDGSRIQPLSTVHGIGYADYSHGIRFVSPNMTLDGKTVKLESVLRDPKLAGLVSDEGALKIVRYPTPAGEPGSSPPDSNSNLASLANMSLYALGLLDILSWSGRT